MSVILHGVTAAQLQDLARAHLPQGAGLAKYLYRLWLRAGQFQPETADLSPRSAAIWRQWIDVTLPTVQEVIRETISTEHGPVVTAKAVLTLADGRRVECVHIPRGRGRYSLCLSTQVGCKMACAFCETGRMGLVRQLGADEIVAQLLVARHRLRWQVDNVVFMGMGEPLDNYDQLNKTLAIFRDPHGLALSASRITVCTVGHVPGIRALAAGGHGRLGLAVSLNAARDDLRSQLMPINRRWPLAALQEALLCYRPRRNAQLAVHYCLLPGINDADIDVRAIADFIRPLGRTLVSLIPYNPGTDVLTRPPTEGEIQGFVNRLRQEGVAVRRRITKGRSVMAACGQLGTASASP